MRSAALLVALLVLLPAAARAQDPTPIAGTEPVSQDLLRGRSLVLERGNCSVDTPAGFEWLASSSFSEKHPEVSLYLCRDGKQSNIFMLQVYDSNFAALDEKGMEGFLKGAQGSMEQQGWQFDSREFKPSTIPIEGSYRFTVKLRKEGQTLYWIGYVATAQRMYCLSSMQDKPGERPEFNAFSKSFRLLHPASSAGSLLAYAPFVILSVMVGCVVVFIQSKRKKGEEPAKGEAAPKEEEDESDETDAFKPKPIVPSKAKARPEEAPRKEKTAARPSPLEAPKGKTRRDARPDEDSKQRREKRDARPRPDEKSDRERGRDRPRRDEKPERPFG